jgi:hypothetical protein
MGERMWKGGESGATGPPTMDDEGVGWCSVRIGLSCVDASDVDDSGFERGDGVRGGLDTEFRGLK